jgi:hypothetical protein
MTELFFLLSNFDCFFPNPMVLSCLREPNRRVPTSSEEKVAFILPAGRTSWQFLDDGDGEFPARGCDRVWYVPFRSIGRGLGAQFDAIGSPVLVRVSLSNRLLSKVAKASTGNAPQAGEWAITARPSWSNDNRQPEAQGLSQSCLRSAAI